MAPDRTILHLVKTNYGVHTNKPHLRPCTVCPLVDKSYRSLAYLKGYL